jgi:hypothetical protein
MLMGYYEMHKLYSYAVYCEHNKWGTTKFTNCTHMQYTVNTTNGALRNAQTVLICSILWPPQMGHYKMHKLYSYAVLWTPQMGHYEMHKLYSYAVYCEHHKCTNCTHMQYTMNTTNAQTVLICTILWKPQMHTLYSYAVYCEHHIICPFTPMYFNKAAILLWYQVFLHYELFHNSLCFKYWWGSATGACKVDWYHVYVIVMYKSVFYKMNHWVLISDKSGHCFSLTFAAIVPCLLTFCCHLEHFSECGSQNGKLFLMATQWMVGQ